MKLRELKSIIDQTCEDIHELGDLEVVVVLSEPSIGAVANTRVRYAGRGIDWEGGMFLLYPTDSLKRTKE